MPLGNAKVPQYKTPKQAVTQWSTWRKGLNTLLRETEIDKTEIVAGTNLLLVGSGIPTKRWGTANYFLSSATGYGRGLLPVKDATDNIQVLAITDQGILTKQNNATFTAIAGYSWASGYNVEMAQLAGKVYVMNGVQPMVRYNFTSLVGFATISPPSALLATNFSGATGLNTWSWKVTAVVPSGETAASPPVSLASLPQDLSKTEVIINWSATSAASLQGYNVYRGTPGNEVYVGGVGPVTTQFVDFGLVSPSPLKTAPTTDSSSGLIGKYIIRWQDRLVIAGIPGDPTAVWISGRAPTNQEQFDVTHGGAVIHIEPDSGEDITGISTYYQSSTFSQTIIIFKERSVWEVSLANVTFGNFVILNPNYRLLTASQGCSSHRSIVQVENDIMFCNRRGIFILRYEPQLLNVINANEISAKIRPFFQSLTSADITAATAFYADKKYVVSFPMAKQSIMFDRERLSFMGPWNTGNGFNKMSTYIDSSGIERWIAIDADDQYVTEFRSTYPDDKGVGFRSVFRSRKEDFGDWTLFKSISELYALFANVSGQVSVNIYLEQRDGSTVTAKSFQITSSTSGQSGIGTDDFGLFEFGTSNNNVKGVAGELPKKTFLYKTARTFQVEIITNNSADNYQLLGITCVATPQARGNSPSSWLT